MSGGVQDSIVAYNNTSNIWYEKVHILNLFNLRCWAINRCTSLWDGKYGVRSRTLQGMGKNYLPIISSDKR